MKDNERAGLAYAILGFCSLSLGDAIIKSMAGDWPVVAVAALRFTFGALGLSVLLLLNEGTAAFRPLNPWLQIARGVCLALASLFFFSAIYIMPLAEAMSIAFISPVLVQILSGPLLGEKVRPAVWGVSLVALAGVFVILRPNVFEMGLSAFFPVLSAIFFALMIIANRASAGQGSALSMQVFVAGICAPLLILVAMISRSTGVEAFQFGWPQWDVIARCAAVAVTASTAHWLVYIGTQRAGASTIAPASYVQILVAISLGWWWFGDIPDAITLIGATMIISAGLYLWRSGKPVPARDTR